MGESPIANSSDVVVCYCDSDATYCDAFLRGLESLRDEQVISSWQKCLVSSESVVNLPANKPSQVFLVLLSPEFLTTGFMQRKEFLARVNGQDDARPAVITALVRPLEMTLRTLNDTVAPASDSRPLSEEPDLTSAVEQIVARIRDAAKLRSANHNGAAAQNGSDAMDRTIQLPSAASPSSTQAAPQSHTDRSQATTSMTEGGAPGRIGRYRIISVLGEGAFGAVYLAQDEQLDRSVAIKTPHQRRITRPTDVESYMREAKMVAQLDHPGIVPVFDVGRTDDGQFFVVSKVIEGKDLSKRLSAGRPSLLESARLVALVAEALHYAHQRDLVHRDVKPANILIGNVDGRPYVTDFGLAIREEELGRGPTRAGTPAYMSPEQARGEGHRVDGRSDVFSLGVVLYELITGRLPFRQQNIEELLAQIAKSEARPPRQIEASIPRELERICLKAMSNRIKDRYTTAQDFADDLWFFVNSGSSLQSSGFQTAGGSGSARDSGGAWENPSAGWTSSGSFDKAKRSSSTGGRESMKSSRKVTEGPASGVSRTTPVSRSTTSGSAQATVASDSQVPTEAGTAKVVAKGLRAFDNHDAEFFLELVPGPRDRYGLPDSIRFWKTRLEETNSDQTFSVGVVYGPSGCGKTSLMRAGLLPQLSPNVHVVFLDATARDTEARLAQRIKNICADASPNAGLAELVAWIRRGRGIPWESKLVVVIDQFEQWLQAHEADRGDELLDALRQCDGIRVQCLLMVRVDFMMSIHRFMNDLETPIQEGANSAPVDLFDALHARKVLRLFGASYGRLPEEPEPLDVASEKFLNEAIAELGPEGKVIPVHLALFADMCKGRPWRPDTLKQLGGTRGVGATFLEETFESTSAPLVHRVHEKASRAVLKNLLPDVGTHIRGQAKSRKQLADVSGYPSNSGDFNALLGILDRDTRLITPVERETPSQAVASDESGGPADDNARYQLTHDYLVPSLREWLTKKQKETARGRAELRLEEYSQLWNDKPSPERLPGLADWVDMRVRTSASKWTPPQRKMMNAAGRRIGLRVAGTAAAVLCLIWAGVSVNRRLQAQRIEGIVEQLATAKISSVPSIVSALTPARSAAAPLLLTGYGADDASPQRRLNSALAALSLEAGGTQTEEMVDKVYTSMLSAEPDDLATMLGCVSAQSQRLGDRASADFNKASDQTPGLLPMASVVAAFRPKSEWQSMASKAVANQLVTAPADAIGGWARQLQPVQQQLVAPLQEVFEDVNRPAPQRNTAGDLLVVFAPEDDAARVASLVDLLEHSTSPEQFKRILKELEPLAGRAAPALAARLTELAKLAEKLFGFAREELGRRQMYLVAAQLQLGASDAGWQAFQHSPEPTVRSLLIENLPVLGVVAPAAVMERLRTEPDLGVRRALILSLGGYPKSQLESLNLADFSRSLQQWSVSEDAGLRGATNWLLDQWAAKQLIQPVVNPGSRDEKAALAATGGAPSWYSAGQGHEMVVFRGPIEFNMGSPTEDPDREGGALDETELRHPVRIPRSFSIATKEVTVDQFLTAWSDLKNRKEFLGADGKPIDAFDYAAEKSPERSCPANNVEWFKAAAYCNWLSQKEGLAPEQWCYRDEGPFSHRMVLKRKYLTLTGYRLPTEAEWEYACRSGTTSGRFFGEAPGLLKSYAWYDGNNQRRTWPVGSLKPNEFGLFDVYGNVSEWCQDKPRKYSDAVYDDIEVEGFNGSELFVDAEQLRVHRGGAFQYMPKMVTSAARDRSDPDYAYFSLGFRVARTLSPAAPTPEGKN